MARPERLELPTYWFEVIDSTRMLLITIDEQMA